MKSMPKSITLEEMQNYIEKLFVVNERRTLSEHKMRSRFAKKMMKENYEKNSKEIRTCRVLMIFRSRKTFSTTYALVIFSPDLSMKILKFSSCPYYFYEI